MTFSMTVGTLTIDPSFDIRYYPVSGQESGIRLDPVSGTKRYLVLSGIRPGIGYPIGSGILYLVKNDIRYYLVSCIQ